MFLSMCQPYILCGWSHCIHSIGTNIWHGEA